MATVGRSIFRLRHYDCVGFDMVLTFITIEISTLSQLDFYLFISKDHTLCRYKLGAVFEMVWQCSTFPRDRF